MTKIVLTGLLLILVGIILLLLAIITRSNELWSVVVNHLGAVMIGAGVVELVVQYVARKDLVENVASRVLAGLRLPISAFYTTRSEMGPWSKRVQSAKELLIMWHAGTIGQTQEVFTSNRGGRAVFPKPSDENLIPLCKVANSELVLVRKAIEYNTEAFLLLPNVKVKWFDGPIQNSVTIADPDSDRGWLHVELLVPKQIAERRPSFLVEKNKSQELFEKYRAAFEAVWNDSKDPEL